MKKSSLIFVLFQSLSLSLYAGGMWDDDEEDLSQLSTEELFELEEITREAEQLEKEEIDLSAFARSIYSRSGEDGVLEELFNLIGDKNSYFVEIGIGKDGEEGNALHLKLDKDWKGVILDPEIEDLSLGIHAEEITPENVISLLDKYQVPKEFSLLSIGMDFCNTEIWNAINNRFDPDVVILPFDPHHRSFPLADLPSDLPTKIELLSTYFAQIDRAFEIGSGKGYSLVFADGNSMNLFFVRSALLKQNNIKVKGENQIRTLLRSVGNMTLDLALFPHIQNSRNFKLKLPSKR